MALTFVQYTGDGIANSFGVPFPYLDKAHVIGRINGNEAPITFTSDNMVRFASPPSNGSLIELRRKTPNELRMVDFNDGSVLTEYDLDLNAIQTFYIVQEAIDLAGGTLLVNSDGSYSANGRRLTALGRPVNSNDAVTLGYFTGDFLPQMQALLASTTTAKDTAVSKASEATTSASLAASSASTATTKATAAANSATAAASSASTATTKATAAANSASAAASSASDAAITAGQAATSATNAAASASAASGHAASAATSASNASTYLTNVQTHANTASTKAQEAKDAATAAGLSKDAAANSATLASNQAASCGTHATNAANSATAAANSASAAASSATAAANSLSQMDTQAEDAAASAGAALAAADSAIAASTTASEKATAAANSATAAASSASTATTKATQAGNSATNAAASASTATDKATIATTKASEAAASASTATTKATDAASSASAAANSATAAASSASDAAIVAGQAASSATNAANSASAAASSATAAANAASTIALPSTTYASRYLRRNSGNTAYELRTAAQVLADIGAFSASGGAISGAVSFGSTTTFAGASTFNGTVTFNDSITIPNADGRLFTMSSATVSTNTKIAPGVLALSHPTQPSIVFRDTDVDKVYVQWLDTYFNIGLAGKNNSIRLNANNEIAFHFSNTATIRFMLQSDGNMVLYNGSTATWSSSMQLSDPKFKDNIKPLENCLETIQKINSVTFTWNDKLENMAGKEDFGVIATEVQEAFPLLVNTSPNGDLSVKYDKIAVLLIGAVKELTQRIEKLEAELALERGLGVK